MDDNLGKSIEFLKTLNQQLVNVISEAPDEYNRILKTYFKNELFKHTSLKQGIEALLVASPICTYSPLPSVATSAAALPINAGATYIGGTAFYTSTAGTTGTELALAGSSGVTTSGTAIGATASAGGPILAMALKWVAIAIATYFSAKYITQAVLSMAWVKKGEKKLETFQSNVITMRVYCNSMTSNLESALGYLKTAVEKIAIVEQKISKQQYATRDSNLEEIQKRKNEITDLYNTLLGTIDLVKVVKTNLDLLI